MSRNTTIILFVLAVGITMAWLHHRHNQSGSMSLSSHKNHHGGHYHHHHDIIGNVKRTKKLMSPFLIEIKSDQESDALNLGEEVNLVAVITSEKTINDVNFKWDLPAHVELLSGALTGGADKIEAGQKIEARLRIRPVEGKDDPIHIRVFTNSGPQNVTKSEQYFLFSQYHKREAVKKLSKGLYYENSDSSQQKVFQ